MTYEEFASDLPEDGKFSFSSVEENEETMQRLGVNQQVRQLGKGDFRSDVAALSTRHADFFADRFNRAVSIYVEPPRGTVGLMICRSANGEFLSSGEQVANDRLVLIPDGSGTDIVAPDLCGSDAVGVSQSRFNELFDLLCPTAIVPEQMSVIDGDTATLHALRNAIVNLVNQREIDPLGERVDNVVAQFVEWVGHSSNDSQLAGITVNTARVRIAKPAQDFIEVHFREAIRIEDLCRVTGVGARTLQRCFRDYFNVTITDYVKAVRLDAARRMLVDSDPKLDSVAAIALRQGFTHLGRFSVDFRTYFGESPRETLAARPRQKSQPRIDLAS